MGKILLEGMEFFAHHGIYDEEQKIGNKYGVDVIITADFAQAAQTDALSHTVNYKTVYNIVAEVMLEKHRLLEHVGYKIIRKLKETLPAVVHVEVHVSKYNPPVGGICQKSKIIIDE
jgi:7,8-dihydroneopterin aldolase/epimerase/oxygenase